MLRPLRFVLLPLLTTYSGIVSPGVAYAKTEAYFARDTNLAELFTAGLGSSQKRLDVILPTLDDQSLVDQLQKLARAGKHLRLLTSSGAGGNKANDCLPCKGLEASGADVRFVDVDVLDFFALVDGPRGSKANGEASELMILSGGLAATGDASLLRFTQEGDYVLTYQNEFDGLWAKAQDEGSVASRPFAPKALKVPGAPAAFFSSANMMPLELPNGWSLTPALDERPGIFGAYLAGAIDHAYYTVDVIARDLHRAEVFAALTQAADRGVQVRVLLEGREFSGKPAPGACADAKSLTEGARNLDECLAQRPTVDLRYLYSPFADGRQPKIQTNYVVIDGEIALAGTFSWSKLGEFTKLGNLVELRGGAVKTYAKQFERSFAFGREPFRKLASGASDDALCGRLKTVSLDLAQMHRLRSHMQSEACD